MSNLAVANQYAKALLEAISKPGAGPEAGVSAELALAQLDQFVELMHGSTDLHTVLLSPAVSHVAKQKVLAKLGDLLGMHRQLKNFLYVVTRHRRLDLMKEIRERFQALLDESVGIVRARVETAQPLTDAQRASLEEALARITGKQVRCGYDVDDALLGGLAVRMGSTMYDGSVRGQLEGLRRRLTSE